MKIPKFEDEMDKIRKNTQLKEYDHDCKLSPNDGCEVCQENWEIKEKYEEKSK